MDLQFSIINWIWSRAEGKWLKHLGPSYYGITSNLLLHEMSNFFKFGKMICRYLSRQEWWIDVNPSNMESSLNSESLLSTDWNTSRKWSWDAYSARRKSFLGGVSLLTVPLTDYRNGKIVNCLFSKTTINARLAQCSPYCCF